MAIGAPLKLYVYVPVNGLELGLYLYRQKDHLASVNIERPADSADVKLVKKLLRVMIAKEPSARPNIQKVVDNLNYLLTMLKAKEVQEVPDIFKSKIYIINIYFFSIMVCFVSTTSNTDYHLQVHKPYTEAQQLQNKTFYSCTCLQ